MQQQKNRPSSSEVDLEPLDLSSFTLPKVDDILKKLQDEAQRLEPKREPEREQCGCW